GLGRSLRPQHNVRDFALCLSLILGIAAPLAGLVPAVAMQMVAGLDFVGTWRIWWMAECVGMISLWPLVMTLSRQRLHELFMPGRRWEFAGILVGSLLVTFLALPS